MTLAPVISSTGTSAPAFADILTYLQNLMEGIYGTDLYLDPDSQDGQFLAALAALLQDNNNAIIAAVNAYSPATAQGTGLSSIVKINGIRRLVASNSQAVVSVAGQVGTSIVNGVVTDQFGTRWDLPALVVIPSAGTIDVTATCEQLGAFSAPIGALNTIATPTRGWQSVTNAAEGTPGNPVESDALLRQRQAASTAIPALTVLAAILGAIDNLTGVGRAFIYENDGSTTDSNGLPDHSICAVVEGGDVTQIATTIALYKTPGTNTYGTTSEVVINSFGLPITINFDVLTIIEIYTIIKLKALTGYVSTTGVAIQAAIAQWLTTLAIGEDSYVSRLYSPANLTGDAATIATGVPQSSLDALSATYNVTAIYQARADMETTAGPYTAGNTAITLINTGGIAIGMAIALILDDDSFLYTTASNVVGEIVTMANAVPGGRNVANGSLMYAAGDLTVAFNEATAASPANTTLVVS